MYIYNKYASSHIIYTHVYNTPAARKAGLPHTKQNVLPRSLPQSQAFPPS